jgi:DNA-binding NtrC family response regulator
MSLDARVLVVDDDESQRKHLAGFLRDLGSDVAESGDGESALEEARRVLPDIVITDFRMPGMDGLALVREVKAVNPEVEVVVVTAYGTVSDAVACLKAGATDYMIKPLDLDEVEHVLRRAVERRFLVRENRELRRRLGEMESLPGIVTGGGPMAEVLSTIARVAPTPVSVLIYGESGTGKELIARALHAASQRKDGPFVAVNAAALSPTLLESELFGHERGAFTGADRTREGRFEAASGGTLFLDEVGDLPPEVQVKLLRVLQDRAVERVGSSKPRPVDVRIVSATHRDLLSEVKEGRFREDLYYRLSVVAVELPPLRRRRTDIPLLVEHFSKKHEAMGIPARSFSREAMDRLVRYDYPGNVRELENIVQRVLVLTRGDVVASEDLPSSLRDGEGRESPGMVVIEGATLPEQIAAFESRAIEEALRAENGNQTRAARRLGISERALRYKLAKLREAARPGDRADD